MPTYEITGPDGTKYEVTGPGTEQEALAQVQAQQQAPQEPVQPQQPAGPGYGEDMLKAAPSGLRSGIEGIPGMFGNVNQLQGSLAAKAAGWMGASPKMQEFVRNVGRRASLMPFAPTSEEIGGATDAAVKAVPGSEQFQDVTRYQPKTLPGKIVRTAAEIAPSMLAGPGGVVRKGVQTVTSSVGGELAGAATEGTKWEPWARAAGMVLGGALPALKTPSVVKMAAKGAPSQETLKTQTDRLYTGLREAGIQYDADAFTGTVAKMVTGLRKEGLRPVGKIKEAFDWVGQMAEDVGTSPSFDDINAYRTQIGAAARDAYKTPEGQQLGHALDIVMDHLDDFERAAPLTSTKGVAHETINEARGMARKLALRNIKQRALDDIVAKADTYQSGRDAGIRNGIGNLLRSKRGMALFDDAERKALLDVQHNRKALRSLGKLGIDFERASGNLSLVPATAASGAGTVAALSGAPIMPIVGGVMAAGTAAKFAAPRLTERALDQVGAAMRSGKLNSPELAKSAKSVRNQRLLRALLAAGGAR